MSSSLETLLYIRLNEHCINYRLIRIFTQLLLMSFRPQCQDINSPAICGALSRRGPKHKCTYDLLESSNLKSNTYLLTCFTFTLADSQLEKNPKMVISVLQIYKALIQVRQLKCILHFFFQNKFNIIHEGCLWYICVSCYYYFRKFRTQFLDDKS